MKQFPLPKNLNRGAVGVPESPENSGCGGLVLFLIVLLAIVGGLIWGFITLMKTHPVIGISILVAGILLIALLVFLFILLLKKSDEAEKKRQAEKKNRKNDTKNPYTFSVPTVNAAGKTVNPTRKEAPKKMITYRVCGYCQRTIPDGVMKCEFCGADVSESSIIEKEDDNHDER